MSRRPTALHGGACGARTACFFPDHRLSNSASNCEVIRRCRSLDSLRSLGMTEGSLRSLGMTEGSLRSHGMTQTLHRISMVRRETPHLALGAGGACPTAPFRGSRGTLGRSLRPPGSCTASVCIERSVARHARPARLPFLSHRLPNPLRAPLATHMSLRSVEPDGDGIHTGPVRADGRAPARGGPACAGKPWTVDSGAGALHHVIGITLGSGGGVSVAFATAKFGKTKIAPPMIA
jgi:hypothetical protein